MCVKRPGYKVSAAVGDGHNANVGIGYGVCQTPSHCRRGWQESYSVPTDEDWWTILEQHDEDEHGVGELLAAETAKVPNHLTEVQVFQRSSPSQAPLNHTDKAFFEIVNVGVQSVVVEEENDVERGQKNRSSQMETLHEYSRLYRRPRGHDALLRRPVYDPKRE